MALSDDEILAITAPCMPQYAHAEIWATEPEYAKALGIEKGERWTVSELRPEHTLSAARAIEAEVRARDEALIRQLVDALEPFAYEKPAREAVAAGRARLKGKP